MSTRHSNLPFGGGFVGPCNQSIGKAYNAGFIPGSSALPTSTVELSICCNDLWDRDLFSKSDPYCVMYQECEVGHSSNRQLEWREVGCTECIHNDVNPKFSRTFTVNYSFETRQLVKFELYDLDSTSNSHDFLGRCETTLGQIVSAFPQRFVSQLKDVSWSKGKIFIQAEELSANKEIVELEVQASKLDNMDWFSKSDPFFTICKEVPGGGDWNIIYKSETVMNDLNPKWKPFRIALRKLCNCQLDRKLKVDVYDFDDSGNNDLIGSFITCASELQIASVEKSVFQVVNDKKRAKKGPKNYKNSGTFHVTRYNAYTEPTFIDYLQGGTSLNFSVAVDFTASNGSPQSPNSLHFFDPCTMENQYTKAIRSVGDILEDYDTDKMFPALGFGARLPPDGRVSHEFFLNLSLDSPFCHGVDGLLNAYRTALQSVTLHGPTNFSPVIKHVANIASAYSLEKVKQYFVLLILTDGEITDLDATRAAIVAASDLPMSIIIVGIGDADFSSMEALDSDNKLLRAGGKRAVRDIVQFVELRKFMSGKVGGSNLFWDKGALAREVLAEIPQQLVSWMMKHGVKPNLRK